MNILLIEPDIVLGRTYEAALTVAGHSVLTGGHAQDAIRLADTQQPDLILLELQLPGHSGIEFLYEFRSYAEWRKIPIILHTMVAPHILEQQSLHFSSLGIISYLYKPATNLHQLVRTVDEIGELTSV
jgi:DNA-binding response OmpR family regulator